MLRVTTKAEAAPSSKASPVTMPMAHCARWASRAEARTAATLRASTEPASCWAATMIR
jgi:hypothetical protein